MKFDLNGPSLLPFLKDKAYTLLTARDHSVAELREKLKKALDKQPFAQSLALEERERALEQTLLELQDQHLLDDEKFARSWVESRLRFRPRSAIVLRQELRQKGIAEEITKMVLAEIVNDQTQLDAARKLLRSRQSKSREQNTRYLAGKGFPYQIIKQALADN